MAWCFSTKPLPKQMMSHHSITKADGDIWFLPQRGQWVNDILMVPWHVSQFVHTGVSWRQWAIDTIGVGRWHQMSTGHQLSQSGGQPWMAWRCWYGQRKSLLKYANHWIDPFHESHNAPVPYPTMYHFVTEMCARVKIFVTKWCIVGYLSEALWDLSTLKRNCFHFIEICITGCTGSC